VGWRFWVGLAVTGAALYLAMRHVEWDRFAASMRLIDVWWVAGGALLFLSSLVVRAVRWRLLLRQVIDPQSARLRTKDVFSYLLIGYAANNVLPMRMGEIARAYYVAQKEQTSTGGVLATIAVERVFDLLGLVFFVVLLTLTMEMPTEIRVSMIAVEGLAVVALSVLIALSFVDPKLGRLRTILSKVLPQKAAGRVMRLLETFVIGLRTARSKKVLISVGLLSMSIWLLIFGDAFFYTRAFHMGLPFLAAIFVVTVANLGTMIPSSPGGLGVAHYLFVVALGVWHIAREPALGFAVVRHGVSYLLTTSIGLACLWVTSLSFRSLVESTPKASEAAGEAAAVVEGETTAAGTKNAEKTEGVCRVRARPTGAGAEMRDQR
jgi:uncharacterized protein (TIRG00374 family)